MKTTANSNSSDTETLIPQDLILQSILPLLPIKSAIRFQSVSKTWFYFIKHPFFTRLHHSVSQFRNPTTFLILKEQSSFCNIEIVLIDVDRDLMSIEPSRRSYAPIQSDLIRNFGNYFGRVVGTCCGVLCLIYADFALLWNPAIGDAKAVDLPKNDRLFVGFGAVKDGYNNVVNFKLLCIFRDVRTDARFFSVYLLNTNKWSLALSPSFMVDRIEERAGRVYLNGFLYILAWGSKAKESAFLLTFDLKTEALGRIELPTLPGNKCNNFLTVFCGRYLLLAVATDRVDGTIVDIWVLIDEEGSKKHWMRVHNSIGPVRRTRRMETLGYWADGNAVISQNHKSLYFQTEDKCGVFNTRFFRNVCLEYVETLVSVKRISEQDDFQDID